MHNVIEMSDKFSNTELYRSIEALRSKNNERAQYMKRSKGHHSMCKCNECKSYFEFFKIKQFFDSYPDKLMERAIR